MTQNSRNEVEIPFVIAIACVPVTFPHLVDHSYLFLQFQSDSEIDAFVRAKTDTAYHPSCTCKMGQESDSMAVVSNEAKVNAG